MKDAFFIISQLKETRFKKLKELDETQIFIYALPLEIRKHIHFGFKKNHRLLFALNNPAYIHEFNRYKAKDLLLTLNALKSNLPTLQNITEIKAYIPKIPQVSHKTHTPLYFNAPKPHAILQEFTQTQFIQTFEERSKGTFRILARETKLKQIFEEIQNIILNSQKDF